MSMRRGYVSLWMEAAEASISGFGYCYFGGKVAAQFLVDDAIGGSEECKDMEDEVAFSVG